MLPNLGELALAPSPTGVTVNPDGSATLTPEEWANLARLIGEPSAPPALLPSPPGRPPVSSSAIASTSCVKKYRV